MKMTMPKMAVRIWEPRRSLTRWRAQLENARVPPDIKTKAVIAPSSNRNNKIKMLYQFGAPSDENRSRTLEKSTLRLSTVRKFVISKILSIAPDNSDAETWRVAITMIIATNGGNIVNMGNESTMMGLRSVKKF